MDYVQAGQGCLILAHTAFGVHMLGKSQQGRIRDLSGKRLDHLHGVNLLLLCENGVSVALCLALKLPHQGLQAAHLQSVIHSEEVIDSMSPSAWPLGRRKGEW